MSRLSNVVNISTTIHGSLEPKMTHKCDGTWNVWSQADIESAKTADPDNFKGVTAVRDKHCDECGKLISIRKEY